MAINKKNITIQILAFIGLVLSIKLAFIYYAVNYDKYALSSFCSINEFVDCDGAAKTLVSQVLGIPLAYWGIFFYLTVFFLTVVDKLKNCRFLKFLEVFKNQNSYITVLGTVAFACSMVLAWKSVFVIHKLCLLCIITYFIDLLIAIVASSANIKKFFISFKDTFFDFIDGAKTYTKTFIVLVILVVSLLAYSRITYNFIPHIKRHYNILKYRVIDYNPYRVKGNLLGEENAKVVVELYSDFVCPMCYINNIMLHKAVKDLSNVKVVHHNFPFDKQCNKYIDIDMHPYACFMSKAAIAARKQDNYWEMSSLLYENQPIKEDEVLKLATKLNFDIDKFKKDMKSESTLKEIAQELDKTNELDLNATPTMFINGDKVVGIKPYYNLKSLLIEYGAVEKSKPFPKSISDIKDLMLEQ